VYSVIEKLLLKRETTATSIFVNFIATDEQKQNKFLEWYCVEITENKNKEYLMQLEIGGNRELTAEFRHTCIPDDLF